MKAVIQAGGKGTRLRPYTMVLPKPLMPVDGIPVVEMLIKWLRRNGIKEVFITTGYLGHLLKALCGNGEQWGISIYYSEEPEPLGTVGALTLIEDALDSTFLVLNGDLVTDLKLGEFVDFHRAHGDMVTIASTTKKVNVDLGVLESTESLVTNFIEKPVLNYQVSMGMYCMEPDVLNLIPKGVPYGFDDLMAEMLAEDIPVRSYLHEGMWMDIGRPEDFEKAQSYFSSIETNHMLGV